MLHDIRTAHNFWWILIELHIFEYTLNALTLTGNPKDMPKITKAMQTLNKFNILYERDFKIMRTKIQETMKFVHSHTLIAFF